MSYSLQPNFNSHKQKLKRLQKRYRSKLGKSPNEDIKLRAKLELLKELLK